MQIRTAAKPLQLVSVAATVVGIPGIERLMDFGGRRPDGPLSLWR